MKEAKLLPDHRFLLLRLADKNKDLQIDLEEFVAFLENEVKVAKKGTVVAKPAE
jgi:hypothetical protein